jgi:rubrerythrin
MVTHMAKHKDYCPGYKGTLHELAAEIIDMSHEARKELYEILHRKTVEQRRREESLGKENYVTQLRIVEEGLVTAIEGETACWKICKPHTEVERRKP